MTGWTAVVTVALLGTDRRALPDDLAAAHRGHEPTTVLLDLAARHRAQVRSGTPPRRCPPAPRAPEHDRRWALAPAQQLLTRLLARPAPELINAWLAAAAVRGLAPAPEHWAGLAGLAATRSEVDRGVLRQALGAQGVWFVAQNPAWLRLSEALADVGPARPADGPAPEPDEATVLSRPEAALVVAAPWPRSLSVAALRVLLGGRLGWGAARYGAALGARMAVADHDLLLQALDALPTVPDRATPGRPLVREALQAACSAAESRTELDRVFGSPDVATRRPGPSHPEEEP